MFGAKNIGEMLTLFTYTSRIFAVKLRKIPETRIIYSQSTGWDTFLRGNIQRAVHNKFSAEFKARVVRRHCDLKTFGKSENRGILRHLIVPV